MSQMIPLSNYFTDLPLLSKYTYTRKVQDLRYDLFIAVLEYTILYKPRITQEILSLLSSSLIKEPEILNKLGDALNGKDLILLNNIQDDFFVAQMKFRLNQVFEGKDPLYTIPIILQSSVIVIAKDSHSQTVQHFGNEGLIHLHILKSTNEYFILYPKLDEYNRINPTDFIQTSLYSERILHCLHKSYGDCPKCPEKEYEIERSDDDSPISLEIPELKKPQKKADRVLLLAFIMIWLAAICIAVIYNL